MNPHLFVYGTLLGAGGHAMGERLARASRSLGAASLPGRLYDIGGYPGLVETAGCDGIVHGEVVVLAEPAGALAWLDDYEGIVAGRDDNEYARAERRVRLADGREVSAWVYLYRCEPVTAPRIASGRWLDRR